MGANDPSPCLGNDAFLVRAGAALALPAILLAALGLRLYGIDFGLPILSNAYFRPDETLVIVPAVRFIETAGDPRFFIYPNLMATLCAVLYQAYFFLAGLFGFTGAGSVAADFGADPSPYFLIARLVSAAAGILATALVYKIGRKLASRGAALLAALLYATAPLAVRDAHFGVTDTMLALLSAAAVYLFLDLLRAEPGRRGRKLFLCAAAVGLAVSTKYTALVLAPVGLGVVILSKGNDGSGRAVKRFAILAAVAVGIFLALNPYVLIDFTTFKTDLVQEFHHQTHTMERSAPRGMEKLIGPLAYGPGEWFGLLLCGIGLLNPWLRCGWRERMVLAAAPVLYLLPLAFTSAPFFRYAVPAYPFMAVLAALGVQGLSAVKPPALRAGMAGVCVILAVGPPLHRSLRLDRLLATEDTRIQAGKWIEENVPPGVPVFVFCGPQQEPQIAETRSSIRRRIEELERYFGARGGGHLARFHRLLLESGEEGGRPRFEVFRNARSLGSTLRPICVVAASYPVALGGEYGMVPALEVKQAKERVRFIGLPGEADGIRMDRMDYFYLPFSDLDRVERPGPNLEVFIF